MINYVIYDRRTASGRSRRHRVVDCGQAENVWNNIQLCIELSPFRLRLRIFNVRQVIELSMWFLTNRRCWSLRCNKLYASIMWRDFKTLLFYCCLQEELQKQRLRIHVSPFCNPLVDRVHLRLKLICWGQGKLGKEYGHENSIHSALLKFAISFHRHRDAIMHRGGSSLCFQIYYSICKHK